MCLSEDLLDLNETIAHDIFKDINHPWEVLPKIGEFIKMLGSKLSIDEYNKVDDFVWFQS